MHFDFIIKSPPSILSDLQISPNVIIYLVIIVGFSGSSAGKESFCNAGNHGLIPESARSPGEGIVYPLQYYIRLS